MIRIDIAIDAPDELLDTAAFGAGATIDLERATSEDGTYAAVDSIAIVAGEFLYTYWDAGGSETSWYRWRVSNADSDAHSGYSEPFQGDDIDQATVESYASLGDVTAGYKQDLDSRLQARIYTELRTATDQITDLVGFDFFRHPQSGTETFTVEANGGIRLCVHDGLVPDSLTKLELRSSVTDTWDELAASDYVVEDPDKPGHPSFHIRLTGLGTWGRFPCGYDLARLTAARGWPAIPRSVNRATRDRARQLLSWDPTRPGGPVGPEELGAMPGPNRMPDTMYRLRHDYSAWELGLAQCEM